MPTQRHDAVPARHRVSSGRRQPLRRSRPGSGGPATLALIATAALAGLAACASDPADTVDEQTFIDVIVELREADREVRADSLPEDSAVAVFEARRDSILDRHGVTADELRLFAERGVADLEHMTQIWDTISQRLKHVPGRPAGDSLETPITPRTREPRLRPTDAPPRPGFGRPDTLRS